MRLMRYGVRVSSGQTLRDRKRQRTRQALIDAATDLFERFGYDATTVADIAAAADIGTRTFFSYFASKEEVLFPEVDARVRAALDAIANRRPDDRPADLLLNALRDVGPADMVGRLAALRLRLTAAVPPQSHRHVRSSTTDTSRDLAVRLWGRRP